MPEKRFTQAVITDSYNGAVKVGGKVWWEKIYVDGPIYYYEHLLLDII